MGWRDAPTVDGAASGAPAWASAPRLEDRRDARGIPISTREELGLPPAGSGDERRVENPSTWERTLEGAGNAALAVPVAGIGANLALRSMGKAPAVATRGAQSVREILQAFQPKTVREMLALEAGGTAAGAAGGFTGAELEKSGSSPEVVKSGEVLGSMGGPASIASLSRSARNVPIRVLRKMMEKPLAQEGAALSRETGMPLTLGQESGSKALSFFENAARQSWLTGDKVMAADQAQAVKAINRVEEIASRISARDVSAETVGQQVQTALRNAVERTAKLRDAQAKVDYGGVRTLAGGQPVIAYRNVVAKWQEIADRFRDVGGGDAQKIVRQAEAEIKRLTDAPAKGPQLIDTQGKPLASSSQGPTPRTVDVDSARRTRSNYGEGARGTGNVFEDVNPAKNRQLSGELFAAAQADFEAAASAGKPYSAALEHANKNYKAYSDSIRYLEHSVLGKMLGQELADSAFSGQVANTVAGERIAAKIQAMSPSEARNVTEILNRNNPSVLADTKAFILRDALKSGMDVAPSAGGNTVPISYARFIRALPSVSKLEAMGFTKREQNDIANVVKAMTRAGDRSGSNPPGTAHVVNMFDMIASLSGGAVGLVHGGLTEGLVGAAAGAGARQLAGTAAQVTVLRTVAKAMTSEEGRQALLTLSQPRARPQDVAAAMQFLRPESNEQPAQ
jgi:hypothetical protein